MNPTIPLYRRAVLYALVLTHILSPLAAQQIAYLAYQSEPQVVRYTTDPLDPNTVIGFDAQDRIVYVSEEGATRGIRYTAGNQVRDYALDSSLNSRPVFDYGRRQIEVLRQSSARSWYERSVHDAKGDEIFRSVDGGRDLTLQRAARLSVSLPWSDWLQVNFAGPRTIRTVRMITLQDDYLNPVVPTNDLKFTSLGVTDFEVQYRDAVGNWKHLPGAWVTENRNVVATVDVTPTLTSAIRLVVKNAMGANSRVVELEALDTNGANVALAVTGATATASSITDGYPASLAIDGDRRGYRAGIWSGWRDGTAEGARVPAATTTVTSDGWNEYTTHRNAFSKVTRTRNLAPEPTSVSIYSNYRYALERTEMLGKTLDVSRYKTYYGIELWDNWGQFQWFRYNAANQIEWVADEFGYIVYIVRDGYGRPKDVFVGDRLVIRYEYADTTLRWTVKKIVDRADDRVIYKRERDQADAVAPRPDSYTVAKLPGHGIVAEWRHNDPAKDGYMVATYNGLPHALIPLSGTSSEPVARILHLPEDDPEMQERIEYTPDAIFIRFQTAAAKLNGDDVVAGYLAPRFNTSESYAVSGLAYSSTTSGDSGDGDTDGDGDDWDENYPSFGDVITVTATPTGYSTRKPDDNVEYVSFDYTPGPDGPRQTGPAGGPRGGGGGGPVFDIGDAAKEKLVRDAIDAAKEKLRNDRECADVFNQMRNFRPRKYPVEPEWEAAANSIASYRQSGDAFNGGQPCNYATAYIRSDQPAYIYICPNFFDSPSDDAYTIIHEWLHRNGLQEREADRGGARFTSQQITDAVRAACDGNPSTKPDYTP